MLLFCKKNNVEVSAYSVLTPTFIIEPKKGAEMYRPPLVSIGANFWGGTKKLLFL